MPHRTRPRGDLLGTLNRWPRRVLAVLCLLLAAGAAVSDRSARSTARPPERQAPIVVATHAIPAGQPLSPPDVRLAAWPVAVRPAGSLAHTADAVGRRIAGPVQAGEAITSARLVGPGLLSGQRPGVVAVSVCLAAETAGLVHPGDSIDLLAGTPPDSLGQPNRAARTVATRVLVLATLPATADTANPRLIVALDPGIAPQLAAVASCTLVAAVDAPP